MDEIPLPRTAPTPWRSLFDSIATAIAQRCAPRQYCGTRYLCLITRYTSHWIAIMRYKPTQSHSNVDVLLKAGRDAVVNAHNIVETSGAPAAHQLKQQSHMPADAIIIRTNRVRHCDDGYTAHRPRLHGGGVSAEGIAVQDDIGVLQHAKPVAIIAHVVAAQHHQLRKHVTQGLLHALHKSGSNLGSAELFGKQNGMRILLQNISVKYRR